MITYFCIASRWSAANDPFSSFLLRGKETLFLKVKLGKSNLRENLIALLKEVLASNVYKYKVYIKNIFHFSIFFMIYSLMVSKHLRQTLFPSLSRHREPSFLYWPRLHMVLGPLTLSSYGDAGSKSAVACSSTVETAPSTYKGCATKIRRT